MNLKQGPSMGSFRNDSMLEEMLRLNIPVRAKATRKKAGSATFLLCQRFVQISMTLFLKQW